MPGRIGRLELGSNPPLTCKAEVYEPPFNPAIPNGIAGYTPRGIDVDRNGVLWTGLSGGPHMASFDRRKCKIAERADRHRPALPPKAGRSIRRPGRR